MKVIRISEQADVAALARTLLLPDADAATFDRAVAAIKVANPNVDLDRLTPGLFIVIPALDAAGPGAATGDEVAAGPLGALRGVLEAAVGELRELAGQQPASAADRRSVLTTLRDEAIQQSVGDDATLAEALESVAATFRSEGQDIEERVRQVDEMAAQWRAQLEFLINEPDQHQ